MQLEEFKKIFFWEWFHRAYGRGLGFAFALPMVYFVARRRITPRQAGVFSLIFCLGGLQVCVVVFLLLYFDLRNIHLGISKTNTHTLIKIGCCWLVDG